MTESLPGVRSRRAFPMETSPGVLSRSLGPVVGLDEHVVDPGAGFDRHEHRGVRIVSVVLDGALRHEDSSGAVLVVGAGEVLVQAAGDGVRHSETNASATASLRFVQLTVLDASSTPAHLGTLPLAAAGVTVSWRDDTVTGPALVRQPDGEVGRVPAGEQMPLAGRSLVVGLAR